MSLFLNKEDGYFTLTTGGVIVVIAVITILVIMTALLREKPVDTEVEQKSADSGKKFFSAKQLVFSAAALALGFATSFIKIVPMP